MSRGENESERVRADSSAGRVLVGRTEELRLLLSAVSAPPAVVVVEGEAGVGKTRLTAELRAQPAAHERKVVVGSCRHIREPFPLGPVVEALRALRGDLAPDTLSPVAGVLRPWLPEIAHLLPERPALLEDPVAERHCVFRGLLSVLESLGPVILVLEDLHWADEQTLDWLSYVLEDPPPGLSVVLTFRGEEATPAVRALTTRLHSSMSLEHIVLGLLNREETRALAAGILGVDRISDDFTGYLWERTSGLPLAIEEVLALLQARGTLIPRGSGWIRRALAELEVPTRIRDAVLERVSRLSDDGRAVVEAAAVLQVPASSHVLLATCRAPGERGVAGLEETLESGVLAEDGELVGLRHALAAQAVYENVPSPRRRDLHGRAAAALEADRPAPLGQLAHHLRHAGELGRWVAVAEEAADQAVAFGHEPEAMRLLEAVLRDAPLAADQRGRLALKLGRAALETVEGREVIPLLSETLEQDLSPAARAELRFRLALLLHQAGDDSGLQRRLFEEAVEALDQRPDLKAWAMVALGLPGPQEVSPSEQRVWLRRTLEVLPDVEQGPFRVFLLGKVGMALAPIGDPEWRSVTEEVVGQSAGSAFHRHEVNAYCSIGVEAGCAGHHAKAEELLRRALEGATACENGRLELKARAALALLDYCLGSWRGLRERAETLLDRLGDYPRSRIEAEVVAGCLGLAQGEVDGAAARLDAVVRRAEQLGCLDLLPVPLTALVRLALARGATDEAAELADSFLTRVEAGGIWAPAARAVPVLVEAVATAHGEREATRLSTRLAGILSGLDAPFGPAASQHAQGLVHVAEGRRQEAARELLAASESYLQLDAPYEAAQARERAAECLFADGDTRAEATLGMALAAYRALGASWDGARARSLARRHGLRLPAAHRGGRQGYGRSLSPRELEVAELAATGRTNKEIARELFLSPNTVDKHVRAVLRKLHVPSRTALAYELSNGRPRGEDTNGGYAP